MILVDSCGWLEYLSDGELATTYEPYFHVMHELIVPVVVQEDAALGHSVIYSRSGS